MAGEPLDLRSLVDSYSRKTAAARECWRELESALHRCPPWCVAQTRAKVDNGSFDFSRLSEEIPEQIAVRVLSPSSQEVRHFLRFVCGSGGSRESFGEVNGIAFTGVFPASGAVSESEEEHDRSSSIHLTVRVLSEEEQHLREIHCLSHPHMFVAVRRRQVEMSDRERALHVKTIRHRHEVCNTQIEAHVFHHAFSCSERAAFQSSLRCYIEAQLRSLMDIVTSQIMTCATEAMI